MSRIENIRNLLIKALKKEEKYVSNIRNELDRVLRIYRNDVPKEEFMKIYDMLINEVTTRNLIYQSMVKELNNDYLDKGEAHE